MRKPFAVALFFCATSTFAGAFLKIGNINGASTSSDHTGWVSLDKFSVGPPLTFGGRTGTWSAQLRIGDRFPEAIVDDGTSRYTFKNVVVTSFAPGLTPAPTYLPLATFTGTYGSYTVTRRAITTPTPSLGGAVSAPVTAPVTKKP